MLRLGLGVLITVLVVIAVGSGGQFGQLTPSAQAQDGDQCVQLTTQALAEAVSACAGVAPGEVCWGMGSVEGSFDGDALSTISGGNPKIAELKSLATLANLENNQWGVATLKLPAGLPEGSAVTAILFGEAQIARPAQVQSDRATLAVFNRGSAPINLRNGAGVTYDMVGQLEAGVETVADGRNEQADWVRIQFGEGVAWVFVPLIGWDGDQAAINALEVLLPNDVTPSTAASGEPFAALTLTTGGAVCPAAPSGLLLQYTGEQAAVLQVNQVTLEFSDATLLVTASANGPLEVKAVSGSAVVTARGIPEEVTAGAVARVNLGGDDGLTPAAAPTASGSYAFADVAYAPLGLLPSAMTCMVGLPAGADIQFRVGPGEQRGLLGKMNPDLTYAVLGWAADPDGKPWWQLETGDTPSWVEQTAVRAIGTCDAVAQVEPPPMVFAPPPLPPAGEGGGDVTSDDLSPAANSVWQMVPGSDNQTGTCTGAPAINFCDHLAAISPASGGISWRGMEANPYYLVRLQPNVYAYSGPNILGTGTINLTLTFTSETTLKMTMVLTLRSEPNCQHTYFYSGSKNW